MPPNVTAPTTAAPVASPRFANPTSRSGYHGGVDAVTRKKIEALLRFLRNQGKTPLTARKLSESFQLDPVIVRALAADEGIPLRDTGELPLVDDEADTMKMHLPPEKLKPKKGNGRDDS